MRKHYLQSEILPYTNLNPSQSSVNPFPPLASGEMGTAAGRLLTPLVTQAGSSLLSVHPAVRHVGQSPDEG